MILLYFFARECAAQNCMMTTISAAPLVGGSQSACSCADCAKTVGSELQVNAGDATADYPVAMSTLMLTASAGISCHASSASSSRCWGLAKSGLSITKAPTVGVELAATAYTAIPLARLSNTVALACPFIAARCSGRTMEQWLSSRLPRLQATRGVRAPSGVWWDLQAPRPWLATRL
jgi:hypothetical protein